MTDNTDAFIHLSAMDEEDPELLSYERVETGMRRALNRQASLLKQLAEAGHAAAAAEAEYTSAYAAARVAERFRWIEMDKRPTQDPIDDAAHAATKDLLAVKLASKAQVDYLKRALSACEAMLESCRSLMATHRRITS